MTEKLSGNLLSKLGFGTVINVFHCELLQFFHLSSKPMQPVQTLDYIDSIKAFFFSDNRQLRSFTEPDPPLMHR